MEILERKGNKTILQLWKPYKRGSVIDFEYPKQIFNSKARAYTVLK